MRTCSRTMSIPVTSSVTGCSTWSRQFTSMKWNEPSGPSRNSNVPAFRYPIAAHARSTALSISSRAAASSAGDGDSSISFWCRRWTEHSRSPSVRMPPAESQSTCTSTWRAGTSAFSR